MVLINDSTPLVLSQQILTCLRLRPISIFHAYGPDLDIVNILYILLLHKLINRHEKHEAFNLLVNNIAIRRYIEFYLITLHSSMGFLFIVII